MYQYIISLFHFANFSTYRVYRELLNKSELSYFQTFISFLTILYFTFSLSIFTGEEVQPNGLLPHHDLG